MFPVTHLLLKLIIGDPDELPLVTSQGICILLLHRKHSAVLLLVVRPLIPPGRRCLCISLCRCARTCTAVHGGSMAAGVFAMFVQCS